MRETGGTKMWGKVQKGLFIAAAKPSTNHELMGVVVLIRIIKFIIFYRIKLMNIYKR